jgi:hypothetical protein
LLVAVCVALANGLIAPWLPYEHLRALQIPNLATEVAANPTGKGEEKRRATTQSQSAATGGAKPFTMTSEASSDFKKALEVILTKKIHTNPIVYYSLKYVHLFKICDYALNITNGENLADVVSLKARFPLIKTWVIVKQFNQSPIKNLGLSKTNSVSELSFLNHRNKTKLIFFIFIRELYARRTNSPSV